MVSLLFQDDPIRIVTANQYNIGIKIANMEESFEDEPQQWRSTCKLPFKQISFGLKQIIKDGVPSHLKELQNALKVFCVHLYVKIKNWFNYIAKYIVMELA